MLIQDIENYLSIRQVVGFRVKTDEGYLRNYAQFAIKRGDEYVINKTAVDWASQALSEAQRAVRLKVIIKFARFIRAENDNHQIPGEHIFCAKRVRPTPYIFNEEEIKNLIIYASHLEPQESLRPHTYSTLFGLLAVAGLRPSEALSLKFKDITEDGFFIRETKFSKSRFIPLHETSIAALQDYLSHRHKFICFDDHIFVSRLRRKLSYRTVSQTFQKVLKETGIPKKNVQKKPRLMDLRHTFAVKALETCPDGRDNIRQHMLALTTYMGHARVESTYWYLESTFSLMNDIATTCELFVKKNGGV